jgi:hypothetical protein
VFKPDDLPVIASGMLDVGVLVWFSGGLGLDAKEFA